MTSFPKNCTFLSMECSTTVCSHFFPGDPGSNPGWSTVIMLSNSSWYLCKAICNTKLMMDLTIECNPMWLGVAFVHGIAIATSVLIQTQCEADVRKTEVGVISCGRFTHIAQMAHLMVEVNGTQLLTRWLHWLVQYSRRRWTIWTFKFLQFCCFLEICVTKTINLRSIVIWQPSKNCKVSKKCFKNKCIFIFKLAQEIFWSLKQFTLFFSRISM